MLLKEILHYHKLHNTNSFVCFLDATKAFDRVNHSVLFTKLKEKNVPLYIIRLLHNWYYNQCVFVRWGSAIRSVIHPKNGVMQGGKLSPFLFNIYIDIISEKLNNFCIGSVI